MYVVGEWIPLQEVPVIYCVLLGVQTSSVIPMRCPFQSNLDATYFSSFSTCALSVCNDLCREYRYFNCAVYLLCGFVTEKKERSNTTSFCVPSNRRLYSNPHPTFWLQDFGYSYVSFSRNNFTSVMGTASLQLGIKCSWWYTYIRLTREREWNTLREASESGGSTVTGDWGGLAKGKTNSKI